MGGLDTCVKGVSNLEPAMAILKLGCYGEVFVLQCEGQETRAGTKSRANKWGNPELISSEFPPTHLSPGAGPGLPMAEPT